MDELLGVRHRQGLEQDRVDDGEDGGVGADAEGQRQDGGGGKPAILPEQAEPEPYVLQHLQLYAPPPEPVHRPFLRDPCQPFGFC